MSSKQLKPEKNRRMLMAYLRELIRFSRRKTTVSMILFFFLGLTQGIGLMMIIPMLHALNLTGGRNAGSLSGINDFVNRALSFLGLPFNLYTILGIYVLVITLFAVLKRSQVVVNAALQQGFVNHLRHRLYESLTYADWMFTLSRKSSDITHALTSDIKVVGTGTHFLFQFFSEIMLVAFHIGAAMLLSVPLTSITLVFGIIMMLSMRRMNRIAVNTGQAFRFSRKALFGAVMEHLVGMKTAKSYGVEAHHIGKIQEINRQIATQQIDFAKVRATSRMYSEIAAVSALAIYFAAAFKIKSFHIPVAQLLVLVFIFSRLMPRFSNLLQSIQNIKNMLPSFSGLSEMHKQAVEAREFSPSKEEIKINLQQNITFHDVTFRYQAESNRNALEHANFEIPAGKVTAVTGRSGAGKSTLADLLLGLLRPTRGKITIDGKELTGELLLSWRHAIGYVPQETFLFHDTLRANLLWAMPDAQDSEIWESLRLAAAEDFVRALPQGLETVVGDRGITLSGGERQRLALARALLRKPQLLLLDEATSALDLENETRIQQALQSLHGQLTIIIIAHRESTIKLADKIIQMDQGKIIKD